MRFFKSVKRTFVLLGIDKVVAALAHRTNSRLLKRLIPDQTYYSSHTRNITRYGVKFRIKPADLSQWFMYADSNDHHVEAAMRSMSPGQGLILDVGANIGHFSLLLAKQIEKKNLNKKIVAFEPNPKVFASLLHNINLNPDLSNFVVVKNYGIGDKEGDLEIQIPHRNSGAGTILGDYSKEPSDKFTVSIKKLDDIIKEPVEFIKIDVEGYEYFVIMGAKSIIETYHPRIYIETINVQAHQKEIFAFLKKCKYQFFKEMANGFTEIELTDNELKSMETLTNILAV